MADVLRSSWHIFPARFLSSSFLSSFFFLLSSAYSGSAPGCTVLVKGKRCIQGSFIGPTSSRVDVICFGFISNPFPVFYHFPHSFPSPSLLSIFDWPLCSMFVLYVRVRPSSNTLCYAFSLFTSPFFRFTWTRRLPLFLNKILDVSFDTLETIYIYIYTIVVEHN